nr:peptidyl-tRNA hydrolase, mitochondrial-like [Ipomoea batatas]
MTWICLLQSCGYCLKVGMEDTMVIGKPPGRMDPTSYVLRPFNRDKELDFTLQSGLEAVRILVLEDFNKSATFVNSAKPLEQFS